MKHALLGLAVVITLTGCSNSSDGMDNVGLYEESREYEVPDEVYEAEQQARADEYLQDQYAEYVEGQTGGAGGWTCSYVPTMNEDWHDDVVCSNGSEQHRPYLREWDEFVTEAELMESASEYAAELNAG